MKKNTFFMCLLAIILFASSLGGYLYSRQQTDVIYRPRHVRLANQYQIRPLNVRMKKVIPHSYLYSTPTAGVPHRIGNVSDILASKHYGNLVEPKVLAMAKNQPLYVKISRQGRTLGWVNANDLRGLKSYRLPYVYYSQFWPSKVDDACEIASLKTAMSTEGKGLNASLATMVAGIPHSFDANRGYTHNPYEYGTHSTINPPAMVKVARKYGAHAKNISGANAKKMIYEVTHGNAVVCEGPYMAKKPGSDHDMTIIGYKPGYFYIADPFARDRHQRKTTWVSVSRLMSQYDKSSRQQHALVVY